MKSALLAAAALGAIAYTTPVQAQHMGHEMHQPPAQPAHEQHAPQSAPTPPAEEHAGHQMAMSGALGPYPIAREASGTAWQPDSSEHGGLHLMSGEWTFMAHGKLDLVHSWQEKPRGDDKTFAAGDADGHGSPPGRRRNAAV